MLEIIFTLDYEIHGNGEGSPAALMVEPTDRLLDQFDGHGAKLTVMADVAEILRFGRHLEETGRDEFAYGRIAEQLQRTVESGHDVQLHLHPAYLNATLDDGRWSLDYSEYDLAMLGFDRINEIVGEGKSFLEGLLRPMDDSYRCVASRSANWSMHPSPDIVAALVANGIVADTSVFKHGRRAGAVRFDYAAAHSELVPWRADPRDVCLADPEGELIEIPIYSEHRRIHAFVSTMRIYRALQTRLHPVPGPSGDVADAAGARNSRPRPVSGALRGLVRRHAWKLDFNQCSGRQLIAGLERAARRYDKPGRTLPLVLIGHSKLCTRFNQRQLEPFLRHIAGRPERYRFATLSETARALGRPAAAVAARGA